MLHFRQLIGEFRVYRRLACGGLFLLFLLLGFRRVFGSLRDGWFLSKFARIGEDACVTGGILCESQRVINQVFLKERSLFNHGFVFEK